MPPDPPLNPAAAFRGHGLTVRRWPALILAAVIALLPGATPRDTAPSDTDAIGQTNRDLKASRVETSTVVPPDVRHLLTSLKHKLRDMILDTLNTPGRENRTPREFNLALKARIPRQDQQTDDSEKAEAYPYGGIARIEVLRPQGHRALLVATTTVGIECGGDTSLYIFRRAEKRWKLTLALESNDYEYISGAQDVFRYAISPPDRQGDFFVVAAEVPPWCTSNWRTIRFRVLRVGPRPYEPKVILSETQDAYLGGDPAVYSLKVERDGFSLYWHSGHRFDGMLSRLRVVRYRIDGNRAIRVPPISLRPEDFLDEWVKLPWASASTWSLRSAGPNLQPWHERLNRALEQNCCFSTVSFVQSCGEAADKWQVGIRIDPKRIHDQFPEELFFTITRKAQVFSMQDIAEKRPPGCPGESRPVYEHERGWKLP